MAGGGSDFFLQFGSDAAPFAQKLKTDLAPGVEKIEQLTAALAAYEAQAARSKSGSSPLGITFEGLDQAAARIEQATTNFSRQFGVQIEQLTTKVAGLAEILNSAARTAGRGPASPQRRPVGGPPGNIVPVTGSRPVNRGGAYGGGFSPEQQAILDRQLQARMPPNATRVTPAEQAAAQKQKKASQEVATSANAAADANSASAKQIKTTADALGTLTTRLQALIDTAKTFPVVGGTGAEHHGGEAHHPPVHAPKAASSPKSAVQTAAEQVTNPVPNSRAHPSRVTASDTVKPGEYFLLPGDNPKKPRRAYGIRPGETAGDYTARVEGVRTREQAYQAQLKRLSPEDQEQLRLYGEQYGPFPTPKKRTFRNDFGTVDPALKSGGVLPTETVNARALPPEVSALLRRRDLHAADVSTKSHDFILDELRRDPGLTQEGLGRESKAALRQLDEAILGLKNRSQAARLFNSKRTPDLEALQAGATRRRYLADTGSASAEVSRVQRDITRAERDALGPGAELASNSEAFLSEIAGDKRANPDRARANKVGNAGARARLASDLVAKISGTTPEEFRKQRVRADLERQLKNVTGQTITGSTHADLLNAALSHEAQMHEQLGDSVVNEARVGPTTSRTSTRAAKQDAAVTQATAAVKEASTQVDQVKAQIHDLNAQLAGKRARLARTHEGSQNQQKLQAAVDKLEAQKAQLAEEKKTLNRELANARRRDQRAASRSQNEQAPASAAGGGGNKPPVIPPAPPTASEPPEEPNPFVSSSRRRPQPNLMGGVQNDLNAQTQAARDNQWRLLNEETRRAILAERQNLVGPELSDEERFASISRAAQAMRSDSQYANPELWGAGHPSQRSAERVRALTNMLGLDVGNSGTRGVVQQALGRGASEVGAAGASGNAQRQAAEQAQLAAATERTARMQNILATYTGKQREAYLAEFIAGEKVQQLWASQTATAEELARAYMQLSAAERNRIAVDAKATAIAPTPSTYARLTGRPSTATFGRDLLRHGSYALENTISYTLLFTGYEKLKEVVETGIEGQAAFARLQSELDATGRSTRGVSDALQKISSNTATPIEHVTDAMSELAGVLQNMGTLEFATNVSAQLSNISQGVLNTTQAAIGLRDVIAAYGYTSKAQIQQVADTIAHLSQLTGVNVADITKGTTQLAQEGQSFGLSQRQTSTLAAYITQGTGEPGEAAAEQASRLFSTLNSSQVQNALVQNGVTTQSKFLQGNIAGVLEDLVGKYNKLNPQTRQTIADLMGSGRQARAFDALTRGGPQFVQEFTGGNPSQDAGAMASQHSLYMRTLRGELMKLSEDFQNTGVALQRSGLLDLLGYLAVGLDKLAYAVKYLLNEFADITGMTNAGHEVAHLGIAFLELTAILKLVGRTAAGQAALSSLRAVPGRGMAFLRGQQYIPSSTSVAATNATLTAQQKLNASTLRSAEMLDRLSAAGLRATSASEEAAAAANGLTDTEITAMVRLRLMSASLQGEGATPLKSGGRTAGLGYGLAAVGSIGGMYLGNYLTQHGQSTAGSTVSGASTGAMIGMFLGPEGAAAGALLGGGIGLASSLIGAHNESERVKKRVQQAQQDYTAIAKTGGGDGSAASIKQTTLAALTDTKLAEKAQKAGVSTQDLTRAITASGEAFDQVVQKWKAGGSPADSTISTLDKLRQAYLESGAAAAKASEQIATSNGAMNQTQADLASQYATSVSGLTPQTLRQNPAALKALLNNSGTVVGTPEYRNAALLAGYRLTTPPPPPQALGKLVTTTGPQQEPQLVRSSISPVEQARALKNFLKKPIQTYSDIVLSIDPKTGKPKSYDAEHVSAAQQALNGDLAAEQQAQQQAYQLPVSIAQARSTHQANLGNFSGAANALRSQKSALQAYLATLKPNQQEYWQTLDQIFQVENDITTTLATPKMQRLKIQAANTLNPAGAAAAQYQLAETELENAKKAYDEEINTAAKVLANAKAALDAFIESWNGQIPGDELNTLANLVGNQSKAQGFLNQLKRLAGHTSQEQQAKQDLASAGANQADVQESIDEARAQADMAGIRNNTSQARAQIAEAARQAAVYSSEGDQAKYYQAIAQEKQAEIQLRDAVEAQKESAIAATAALRSLRGEAVGASVADLNKAKEAYRYAVNEYGAKSQQAEEALAQVYQAEGQLYQTQVAQISARLDLQAAQLLARGHLGDDVAAAQKAVQKARAALKSYMQHGGKKGTAEYDQLMGQIVTARRNEIDTAVQAQIDTLDFQQETYKITSSQEVEALQQILKNKQLTLKEQRDITLKIKNLQESIRQQLTEGGLNIPSDIKLPTAYEVRRSLGAGFGGAGTTVNTVNNNNQRVTIQNQVMNQNQINQITSQVINAINTQTNQQLRANSSTPRLVPTR